MRLIDTDHVMKALSGFNDYEHGNWHFLSGIETAREIINAAPTIDAVSLEDYRSIEQTVNKLTKAIADAFPVKHGHWVYVGHGWAGESICKCSMCGHHTPDDGNYCSNCGAKMDEVEDGNDT